MLKHHIAQTLKQSITAVAADLNHLPTDNGALACLKVERPRHPEHGDYAVNVSPLAKLTKMPPPQIAQAILSDLTTRQVDASAIAGFINFRITTDVLAQRLQTLLTTPTLGKNASMADDTILLEYVSANPTGPLHIGHGRWAALGDSLKRIWEHCGAVVTPEFYINDAGVQMMKIAHSTYYRAADILKEAGLFLEFELPEEIPYPGEFVIDIATNLLKQPEYKILLDAHIDYLRKNPEAFVKIDGELPKATADYIVGNHFGPMQNLIKQYVLNNQKSLLEKLGVHFEAWFSESELLHSRGLVEAALSRLKESQFAYEEDGALWLKTTELGDEKDRVLIKSDGSYTYLAADIAYHDQKFNREDDNGQPQYNKIVNIWGADHHGYIARMKAAMVALGHLTTIDDPKFEIVLGQLVNLKIDGERTRMGKRRKMLTLADLIDETEGVGVDATRFWMVSKSADTTLDFDVDLAQSQSNDNPVYYAQYAHARCCSILRNAVQENPNIDTGEMASPFITQAELDELQHHPTLTDIQPLWQSIGDDAQATSALNQLIFRLDDFEEVVCDAARTRSPHIVARYTLDLAADFHSFYNVCRILTDEAATTKARLALILVIRNTLAQALTLLGVSAPLQM